VCHCVQLQQFGVMKGVTNAVNERICVCQNLQLQKFGVVRRITASVHEKVLSVTVHTFQTGWCRAKCNCCYI
jgi:hypothetical protein